MKSHMEAVASDVAATGAGVVGGAATVAAVVCFEKEPEVPAAAFDPLADGSSGDVGRSKEYASGSEA